MAITLTAGALGTERGFSDGSLSAAYGSLVPATLGGMTVKGLFTDSGTPNIIQLLVAAGNLATLTGKDLIVDGVTYTQASVTDFGATGVYASYTAPGYAFVTSTVYSVDMVAPPAYAGPTFVGVSTANGNTASFNITYSSSGRANNDMLLLGIETANQAAAAPSGFVQVPGAANPQSRGMAAAAGGLRGTVFNKSSDGTETTIAIADSGDHQYAVGLVVRPSGGATALAVDVIDGATAPAASTSGSFPGVTTTVDDCLIVTFVFTDRDIAAASWSGEAGGAANLTERFDNGTAAGQGGGIAIYTAEKQAAGATGTITATQAASAFYSSITLAIKNATSGSQALTPSLYTNSQTFYAPTITRGAVTLTPSLFTNAQTFYAPTVALTQTLSPSLLTNSQTFYAPTVTRGAVSLAPSLLTNTQTFYAATVSRGAVALSPSLLTNSQSFPAATVTATYTLAPALLTNAQTFYGPSVSPGAVTLAPTLLSNTQSFYPPTVTQSAIILSPSLVVNAQSFFSPTVAASNAVSTPLVSNTQSFFAPTVSSRKTLTPPLYANDNSFFPATVSLANQILRPDLFVNGGVPHPERRMWRPFMGSFAA